MNKIYLASKSPRRKEILEKFGLQLICINSKIQEKIDFFEAPEQIVMSLAYQKGNSILKLIEDDGIVIGADTILYFKGKVLVKPKTKKEAKNILMNLSGETHEVFTGVYLVDKRSNIKVIDYEKTYVKFKKNNEDIIDKYLEKDVYIDKAGGYGIQGIGSILIDKIDGCYFNVMGLPISKIESLLNDNFDLSLL